MTWQNPWAFIGLLALAVPVIIHLLGRRSARIRKFPTLRFVGTSRMMATRWTTPSDLALLAMRAGILAAAVAALARPAWVTDRGNETARSVARAIIVDTSESMRRSVPAGGGGQRAVDAARAEAQRMASDARSSAFIHTVAPAEALAGAAGWLATQRGRREIVVISDFQIGTIDEVDLRAVPPGIGLELVRLEVAGETAPLTAPTRQDSAAITANIVTDSASTRVEWTLDDSAAGPILDGIVTFASDGELARANAARRAAMLATATVAADGPHPIMVMHREYAGRAEILRVTTPPTAPWHGDVIARLRADPMLAAAASTVTDADVAASVDSVPGPPRADSPIIVLARAPSGRPVAFAGGVNHRGVDHLLLFSDTDAGSLTSAALIAATLRATARPIRVEELDPGTVSEQTLATWRRPAATDASHGVQSDASDGRWLWVLVLVLLGVETWMRRERHRADASPLARERAA